MTYARDPYSHYDLSAAFPWMIIICKWLDEKNAEMHMHEYSDISGIGKCGHIDNRLVVL